MSEEERVDNENILNPRYVLSEAIPRVRIFDIETDQLDATVIHCIVVMDENGDIHRFNHAREGNLREGLEYLKEGDLLIGHNIIAFDLQVIHKLYPGWVTKACVRDTLVCSRLAWPHMRDLDFKRKDFPRELIGSHSLKAWGHRFNFEKFPYGEKEDAFTRWTPEMEEYCVRDVEITHRLLREFIDVKIPDEAVEMEHGIHDVCDMMTWRGFYFDRESAEKLYVKLLAERDQLEKSLQDLFPPKQIQLKTKVKEVPFNPGSRVQIAERFTSQGWKPKEFTPDGRPKINDVILEELSEEFSEAKSLNRFLLIQKRISQLAEGAKSWLGACDENNRIHGQVITCGGTISHRMTHFSPNISGVPSVNSPFGKECRALFCVPPGSVLVGVDLSSIELRMLAHAMSYWDSGRYAREIEEGDIHSKNADDLGISRPQAKVAVFCMIYGGSDQRLGGMINGTKKDGRDLRRRFYDRNPAFRKFVESVKLKTKNEGVLKGLDGRPLYPRSPHSAVNLWIQNAAVTVAKRATLFHFMFLEMSGIQHGIDYFLAAHLHDEWQVEILEQYAEICANTAKNAISAAGEPYALQVALEGEVKVGKNWAETH